MVFYIPGPSIHIAVAERIAIHLSDSEESWDFHLSNISGPTPKDISTIVQKHPNYFALGAIGPDIFALLPDFRAVSTYKVPIANPMIGVLEFLDELYKTLDEWVLERWERYLGPVSQNVDEAISRLTGDISSVVGEILGGMVSIGATALTDLATQSYDWWGFFSLGLNKGYDNQDYFWMDMFHYRKTSGFAKKLWELANKKEFEADPANPEAFAEGKEWADRLRAYAIGYMTHVGTDVTGHPYVNEKTGGPYRTHWQRHHLVENHMDASTYGVDHGSQVNYEMLTKAALYYRISFKDDGSDGPTPPGYLAGDNTLRGNYVRRRHLDLDSEMPKELAQLLYDAMGITYDTAYTPNIKDINKGTNSSPRIIRGGDGRPEPELIQQTYGLFFRYIKYVTLDGFNQEKPEPPILFPNLEFPQLTDPRDDPPGEGDENMDLLDWILAIIRFTLWIAAIAIWLATVIPAALLDVATYGPRITAYYSIQLPLYYMLKAERAVLVMTGYTLPMDDEIDIGLIRLGTGHQDTFLAMLREMDDVLAGLDDAALLGLQTELDALLNVTNLTPEEALARILGEFAASSSPPAEPNDKYPLRHPDEGPKDEFHHPWDYPTTEVELGETLAGPYEMGSLPHILLETGIPGNQSIRSEFENARGPDDTNKINRQVTSTNNLGDPTNFASYLIWQLTRYQFPNNSKETRITDWNLDGDRGYAYKCWDWDRHHPPEKREIRANCADHVLEDTERNLYMEPCNPPPQSEREPCSPKDSNPHNKELPLQLHYTDQQNPGCTPKKGSNR